MDALYAAMLLLRKSIKWLSSDDAGGRCARRCHCCMASTYLARKVLAGGMQQGFLPEKRRKG